MRNVQRIIAIFCFTACCIFLALPYQVSARSARKTAVTKIVLLGTGTPVADPDRSGPSVAIVINDTPYIIDCGPGVIRRASAAARKGIDALKTDNLNHLFITHLHSDHTIGYPDIILTPWVEGRKNPLEVYGPDGIREMTDHILAAYHRDIYMRLYGLEPANTEGYKVNVHEITAGVIYTDQNVTVEAFPVHHGSWHYAYGFKFTTPDRIIVISGDTSPCGSLIEAAKGCDVLIHEVYCQSRFEKRTPEWKRYHSSFHTSTKELADIASAVRPKLLVLYHQLFWGASEEELLDEIQSEYKGKVVSGRDLDIF